MPFWAKFVKDLQLHFIKQVTMVKHGKKLLMEFQMAPIPDVFEKIKVGRACYLQVQKRDYTFHLTMEKTGNNYNWVCLLYQLQI